MTPGSVSRPRSVAAIAVVAYVLTSLTLSGIPGWSRLSAVSFLFLTGVSLIYGLNGLLVLARWIWWPTAFLACCLLWSILTWESASDPLLTTIIAWGGGALVAVHVQNGVRLDLVLKALVAAAAANVTAAAAGFDSYAIYAADFSVVSEEALSRRASGLVGNANELAIQAILPLFALALWGKRVTLLIWAVALICATLALGVSGSRKGLYLAVLFLPFVAYAIPNAKLRRTLLIVAVAATAGIGALLMTAGVEGLPDAIQQLEVVRRVALAISGHDLSYLHRLDLAESGIAAFIDSPLIGYGLDSFRVVAGGGTYAHNNYLELAVNGGIVMLAIYYAVYASAAARTYLAYGSHDRRRYLSWFLMLTMLGLEFGAVSYNDKFFVLLLMLLLMTPSLFAPRERQSSFGARSGPRGAQPREGTVI